MIVKWTPGQRWVSETEPEIGIGRVLIVEFRNVRLEFPSAGTQRIYRKDSAPLKRFILQTGDVARSEKGVSFVIETVSEIDGTFVYSGKGKDLHESDLHHRLNAPRENLFERLREGKAGTLKEFDLRQRSQELICTWMASPVRGMVGPRVDLIPHQLYLCHRACQGSQLPRLLLCDEVGLGKTIEAGMIYHTLRTRGRVLRTLVLLPDSLKHQWMLELMRRFNQFFTLVDEGFIQSVLTGDEKANPFAQRNEVICTMDLLLEEPALTADLMKSSWDLVIVDEAHHLVNEDGYTSPQFLLVQALCGRTRGMLLLTGTPLQLHPESHFQRLRMLDPARFHDFALWEQDQEQYRKLARDLEKVAKCEGEVLDAEQVADMLPANSPIQGWLKSSRGTPMLAGEWVRRTVDALGTGAVVFRNTRRGVGGFPSRRLLPYSLRPSKSYRQHVNALIEQQRDASIDLGMNGMLLLNAAQHWPADERVVWLTKFLGTMKDQKVLLLCSDREVVKALQALLPGIVGPEDFVTFHEEMTLVARDRAAAWFSRPDGARVLAASEIGSEGRNFQFAHHLVLFDLPLDAALVEQRIGRLDRIGQREEIHIHVPYVQGTTQEVFFLWYHNGLDAFLRPLTGGGELYARFQDDLLLAADNPVDCLNNFRDLVLKQVVEAAEKLRSQVEVGRDRLLEFNSRNPAAAAELVHAVEELDIDRRLQKLVLEALGEFGLEVEEASRPRSWVVHAGHHMKVDSFPGIPDKEGITITVDRHEALEREEIAFLSWEHPITQGVFDLTTAAGQGTCCAALWEGAPKRGLVMQYNFLHEPAMAPEWGLADLAPPCLLRVLLDSEGKDCSEWLEHLDIATLRSCSLPSGEMMTKFLGWFAGDGLSKARSIAVPHSHAEALRAAKAVGERLDAEFQRARHLLELRGQSSQSPILSTMRKQTAERAKAALAPQLRLDAVRILVCK